MTDALVALLVCPITRTALRWDREGDRLVSDEAGLSYPVQDGVAVLLAEEATRIGGPSAS